MTQRETDSILLAYMAAKDFEHFRQMLNCIVDPCEVVNIEQIAPNNHNGAMLVSRWNQVSSGEAWRQILNTQTNE